jgi:hypothetical protein
MARGYLGVLSKVQLRQPPMLAPVAQVLAEGTRIIAARGLGRGVHARIVVRRPLRAHYPAGNRLAADPGKSCGLHQRKELPMTVFSSPRFLRNVLMADAAAGAASSLLHLLGAGLLAEWLGLPHGVLVMSGTLLLVYVAAAAYMALCEPIPGSLVSILIAANWAWVGACAVVFFLNSAALTPLGQAYVIVHALAVAVLAELAWLGLRRTRRAAEGLPKAQAV